MPWKVMKEGEQWCVYKHDESGDPVGETLGCHDSEEKAQAQMRALYAAEPKTKSLSFKETVVAFGGAVKALGNGRISGYLVRFTNENELDLEGEYFDAETDYGPHKTSLVYYHHGQDSRLKNRVLVEEEAELRKDEFGIWAEAQLALRDEYERFIYGQAEKGKMGWSSGTAAHLVRREQKDKGIHIAAWPLGLDASITPTPAEPRNTVMPLKSLSMAELQLETEEPPEAGEEPAAVKAEVIATPLEIKTKETEMADEIQEAAQEQPSVEELIERAVTKAFEQMREVPAIEKAVNLEPEGADRLEDKNFGNWCIAVMRGDTKRLDKVYGTKAALNEASGEQGGYLVPPDYSREILRVSTENAVVRPRARVIPMTSREFNMPALDYTGSTAGAPPSLGGVVATWTEEAGTKTETEPTFKTIKLVYHELSGYTIASNMLRQDAGPTLSALLTMLFGEAIAWYEDWAFLRGDGVGKPLGVFNANCLLTEAAGANTCVITDIANMLTKFLPMNPTAGVWVCHPTARSYLIALDDDSNIIWIPNARESLPMTMFGLPVIFSEKVPVFPAAAAAANQGGILLADFSYYLIGSRTGIAIDFSEHYKFVNNQGTWRFVIHVDGQPWLTSAPYLADGTNQISPFVTLAGA